METFPTPVFHLKKRGWRFLGKVHEGKGDKLNDEMKNVYTIVMNTDNEYGNSINLWKKTRKRRKLPNKYYKFNISYRISHYRNI